MAFKTRRPRGSRVVSKGGLSHQPRIDRTPAWKKRKLNSKPGNVRVGESKSMVAKDLPPPAAVESDDDESEAQLVDIEVGISSSYDALLSSLKNSGASFSEIYETRKRDEEGGTESESSEGEESQEDQLSDGENEGSDAEEEGAMADSVSERPSPQLGNGEQAGPKEQLPAKEQSSEGEEAEEEEAEDESGSEEEAESGSEEEGSDSDKEAVLADLPDTFEQQVGHPITDAELAYLTESKPRFQGESAALGIQGGKWMTTSTALPKASCRINDYNVKARLAQQWKRAQKGTRLHGDFVSEQQSQLFSLFHSYSDVLHTSRPGPLEDFSTVADAYLLHVMNHILKSRDRIVKNNDKLSKAAAAEAGEFPAAMADSPRDQGFTRPKVLILLPFRSTALKVVERMLAIIPPAQKAYVEHKDRFMDDFGVEEDEEEEERKKGGSGQKPADHRALFSGNNDDHFRIGMKLTKKSVKLYSEFYSSDIILASPIGLVTQIGEAEGSKDKDVDFLSSIEIVIVDMADVILMQNWSHVSTVFDSVNTIPLRQHGTDFMRIREWYLNGWAKHYRQTILLSAYADPGINALFNRKCANHTGKVKLRCDYTGVLSKVIPQVQQVFERIDCGSIESSDEIRFEYFTRTIYPRIRDSMQGGIMLFVRSYFEFVRIRNFLKAEGASFALLGEYTKQSDISRARSWFFHGERRILLYTERSHFYHRYRIRGIRDLIFLSLPDNAQFYSEMLNLLEGIENPSCTIVFSKFDNLQLERVVGTSRSKKMLSSQNKTFMFC